MELKDYLLKSRAGVSELELMQEAITEVESASLNKFILATLNLNKIIEDIFLNNDVERLSITLKLKFYEEQGTWEVYPYVIQKSDYKEDFEDEGEYGKIEYEERFNYYDEYDVEDDYYNMVNSKLNAKPKNKVTSSKPRVFEVNKDELKIQAINQSLNGACLFLNSHNKLWFGEIKDSNLVIYLSDTKMPDIISHILGDIPKALLAKSNLEIDLPNNNEIPSEKKLKI